MNWKSVIRDGLPPIGPCWVYGINLYGGRPVIAERQFCGKDGHSNCQFYHYDMGGIGDLVSHYILIVPPESPLVEKCNEHRNG